MQDSPLRRIRILRHIIRAADGIQNVLWWAVTPTLAIVAGRRFLGMLKQCEQKKPLQNKRMHVPRAGLLDYQSPRRKVLGHRQDEFGSHYPVDVWS